MMEIKSYMHIQKGLADKRMKINKQNKGSGNSERHNNNSRGGRGGRGRGQSRGRGGRGERGIPCPRHPHGRHTDAECNLNPIKLGTAPYPMPQGGYRQFGGRGFNGRGGRGFGGRGRGGEQYNMCPPVGSMPMPNLQEQYNMQQQQQQQQQSIPQQQQQQVNPYDSYLNMNYGSYQNWSPYGNQG